MPERGATAVAPDPDLELLAVAVARALRASGVAVPPDATVTYAAALVTVGIDHRSGAYWAGRATLVHRPEDIPVYDRVFAAVFDRSGVAAGAGSPPVVEEVTVALDVDDGVADDGGEATAVEGPVVALRWSEREVLRDKDFARCTSTELSELHRLAADLRVTGPTRTSRRLRAGGHRRGVVDLRATARRSLRTGGEPMRTEHRARGRRPRRVVLLCDVSGSMDAYSRALVRFAHVAVTGRSQVEVFTLGTRCTRITRALRTHDPDAALDAAAEAVADWSGGTRLGEGLRSFNDAWGHRGMARGAVVVILSDGWDRGDPDLLAEQTARLRRAAHRLVWVNPLKASAGFAPTAGGMAAALPYVDDLVEGHSLRSLEALAEVIGEAGP